MQEMALAAIAARQIGIVNDTDRGIGMLAKFIKSRIGHQGSGKGQGQDQEDYYRGASHLKWHCWHPE
jgi:hypothetical protein